MVFGEDGSIARAVTDVGIFNAPECQVLIALMPIEGITPRTRRILISIEMTVLADKDEPAFISNPLTLILKENAIANGIPSIQLSYSQNNPETHPSRAGLIWQTGCGGA